MRAFAKFHRSPERTDASDTSLAIVDFGGEEVTVSPMKAKSFTLMFDAGCSSVTNSIADRLSQWVGLGGQLLRRAKKSAGKPQRPEALWHLLFGVPRIDAGKIYVLPAER